MKTDAIDVVVLTLDRERDSHECIDSVLAQDHPQTRLWVVDQGSKPAFLGAMQLRAEQEGFTFVQGARTGVPAGRNRGYGMGEAPLIVSLDNDAILADSGVLTRVAQEFGGDDQLGALAFAVYDYERGGPDLASWGYPWPVESHFDRTFPTARFCGAGHAIRREAWAACGGYDEQLFFFAEELDLCWSLVALGYRVRYVPHIAVRHKCAVENRIDWTDGRFYYNVRNMIYLLRKHLGTPLQLSAYCIGYLIKGIRNRMAGDAVQGIRDGFRMTPPAERAPRPDRDATAYILKHEFRPRGSARLRFRREIHPLLFRTRRQ